MLTAGLMIGNPFSDVPELCSQAVVVTDGGPKLAESEALPEQRRRTRYSARAPQNTGLPQSTPTLATMPKGYGSQTAMAGN